LPKKEKDFWLFVLVVCTNNQKTFFGFVQNSLFHPLMISETVRV